EGYVIDNAQAIVDAGEDRAALQREYKQEIQQLREEKQQLKATVDKLVTRLDQLTQALEQSTALTKAYANTKASQAERAAKAYTDAKTEKVAKLTEAVSVSENGNVGIGTTSPGAKLDVAGNLIRTIAYATGNGPVDGTDVGQIKSRVLRFTKAKTHTKIRINYTDNLATLGSAKACRWEIRVDGRSCPNQALVYDDYAHRHEQTFSSHTVVGYCSGVAAGSHTIGIWVSTTPGYSASNCHTGWKNSTWVIEVIEVN
ncbi:MAG: hypothetical protein DRR19_30775, partial [Candidatus Parabeggiatoa sp. nov. 1]